MKLFDVYPLNPIEITKASGLKVWDNKGQEYLQKISETTQIATFDYYYKKMKKMKNYGTMNAQ